MSTRPPPPPVPSAGICVGCRSSDVPCKCNHSAEGAIVVLLIIGVAVGLFLLGFAVRGSL